MGPLERAIREKLLNLQPVHLEIENESPKHGIPASMEKHFRVVIVSDVFADMSRVERHRKVNDLFAEEFKEGIHALSIQAYAPVEWQKRSGQANASPECLGGSKKDPNKRW
jgi:BolA protein